MKSQIQTQLVLWLVARLFSWKVFVQTFAKTLGSGEHESEGPKVLTMLDSWRKHEEKSLRLYVAAQLKLVGLDYDKIYFWQNQNDGNEIVAEAGQRIDRDVITCSFVASGVSEANVYTCAPTICGTCAPPICKPGPPPICKM